MRSIAETVVAERDGRNHTIRNGLAAEVIEDSNHANDWTPAPTIAAVTSDCPHKCNPTLIRMLSHLVESRPEVPWKLEIAGGGEYRAEKALADQLGLNENIVWRGFLNRPELESHYRKSVCLAFVSSVEAFGNPPLEAMARSCPVVLVIAPPCQKFVVTRLSLCPFVITRPSQNQSSDIGTTPSIGTKKSGWVGPELNSFSGKSAARMFEIFQAVHSDNQNVK